MSWKAQLKLHYTHRDGRTTALDRHEGPLRVLQRLYPEGPGICHHVIVHPPGGVVGGDELQVQARLDEGSHALVTTPGATRFYRSDGAAALQHTQVSLAAGARLEWLPLETLAYSGCIAENRFTAELAPGAEMMAWDLLGLGLPAAGQAWAQGLFTQHLELPGVWLERARLAAGDPLLRSPLGWAGQAVLATLWFAAGEPLAPARRDALLDAARGCIQGHALAPQHRDRHGRGALGWLAARDLKDQLARAFDRHARQLRIHAALETMRGIRVHAELARATADAGRRKMRGFKVNIAAVQRDARGMAAHDSGKANGALRIGNHQEFGVERHRTLVEQGEAFSRRGAAYANGSLQGRRVVGMHGLAEFQHHEAGDVHHRADRAHAGAPQAIAEPARGLCLCVDTPQQAPAEARAVGRRLHVHCKRSCVGGGDGLRIRELKATAQLRGYLTRESVHAQAIGTVGRQAQFDFRIRQAEMIGKRLPHHGIGLQLEKAIEIRVQAQFLAGTQHAVRFDSSQLGRLDGDRTHRAADPGQGRLQANPGIRCTANDLQGFPATSRNAAHLQLVCIGMPLGGNDFRHHDAIQPRTQAFDRLHLQATHGQAMRKIIQPDRDLYKFAQPVFAEFHGLKAGNRE